MSSEFSVPFKAVGSQTAACLVEGCKSDLRKGRDYYRRHRVCEVHAKTPVVIVQGMEKRFCQQCSKFHSVNEFDDVKRSCRKRLDGHNRRRRKHQPGSFYLSSRSMYDPNLPLLRSSETYDQQWLVPEGSKWQPLLQFHQPKIRKEGSFELCFSQRVPDATNVSSRKERKNHEFATSSSSALYLLSTHSKQMPVTGYAHSMALPKPNTHQPYLHLDTESQIGSVEEQLGTSQILVDDLLDSVRVLGPQEIGVGASRFDVHKV